MSKNLVTNLIHKLLEKKNILIFFILFLICFSHNVFSVELDNLFLKLKQSKNTVLARDYENKICKLNDMKYKDIFGNEIKITEDGDIITIEYLIYYFKVSKSEFDKINKKFDECIKVSSTITRRLNTVNKVLMELMIYIT